MGGQGSFIAAYTRMRPTKKSNFSAVWNIWKKLYTPEPQPAAVSRAAVAHRCGATEPKCTARHGAAMKADIAPQQRLILKALSSCELEPAGHRSGRRGH